MTVLTVDVSQVELIIKTALEKTISVGKNKRVSALALSAAESLKKHRSSPNFISRMWATSVRLTNTYVFH